MRTPSVRIRQIASAHRFRDDEGVRNEVLKIFGISKRWIASAFDYELPKREQIGKKDLSCVFGLSKGREELKRLVP